MPHSTSKTTKSAKPAQPPSLADATLDFILGEQDTYSNYKHGRRVITKVIPLTWMHVILAAFINAAAVNAVRVAWYENFGVPQIFAVNPKLDAEILKNQQTAAP